jgi:hypothetical protein
MDVRACLWLPRSPRDCRLSRRGSARHRVGGTRRNHSRSCSKNDRSARYTRVATGMISAVASSLDLPCEPDIPMRTARWSWKEIKAAGGHEMQLQRVPALSPDEEGRGMISRSRCRLSDQLRVSKLRAHSWQKPSSIRDRTENTLACRSPCVGGGKLLERGKKRVHAVQCQWPRRLAVDEV